MRRRGGLRWRRSPGVVSNTCSPAAERFVGTALVEGHPAVVSGHVPTGGVVEANRARGEAGGEEAALEGRSTSGVIWSTVPIS
jgi:hypothetical protein